MSNSEEIGSIFKRGHTSFEARLRHPSFTTFPVVLQDQIFT